VEENYEKCKRDARGQGDILIFLDKIVVNIDVVGYYKI